MAELDTEQFVDQMALLLGLTIPPQLRDGVIANFEHLHTLVQPVIDFPLPDSLESAATFKP